MSPCFYFLFSWCPPHTHTHTHRLPILTVIFVSRSFTVTMCLKMSRKNILKILDFVTSMYIDSTWCKIRTDFCESYLHVHVDIKWFCGFVFLAHFCALYRPLPSFLQSAFKHFIVLLRYKCIIIIVIVNIITIIIIIKYYFSLGFLPSMRKMSNSVARIFRRM